MNDAVTDPYFELRAQLLGATTRHVSRARARVRLVRISILALAVVIALTSLVLAATNRVRTPASPVRGSVLDVFHGIGIGGTPVGGGPGKVLLHRTIDGVTVQIDAVERFGNDGHFKRTKPRTCYTISTDESGRLQRGSVICTPEFNPGMPLNFNQELRTGRDGVMRAAVTSGITASDVVSVDLISRHGTVSAMMGDHAFWSRGVGADRVPLKIRATRRDGTVVERPTFAPYTICNTSRVQRIKAWRVKNAALDACIHDLLAGLKHP
ncbi:MAG: hypothetical protein JWN41_514 [Thermoleophilia bacterium]|nr:hypothetical protein [Thermoleophilia bacterium]